MVMVVTTITRNLDDLFEDTANTNRLWWNLLCSQLNHIVTSVTWSLFRPSYFIITSPGHSGCPKESGYKSGQPILYIFVPLLLVFKILMKPNQIS